MKRTLRSLRFFAFAAAAGTIALAAAASGVQGAPPEGAGVAPVPLAFVTSMSSPAQGRSAAALAASIRAFGGPYAKAPIYTIVTNPEAVAGDRLRELGTIMIPLDLEASVRDWPLAAKAFAAAKAESLTAGKVRSLAWFDPDTLVLNPPAEMDLGDSTAAAAVRPVHVRNIGQPAGVPLDRFWAEVGRRCGLDPGRAFAVEPVVGGGEIKAYFNCGIFAVRPERGILREWARVLGEFVNDREFREGACADDQHRLFLHQAVVNDLLLARLERSEIRLLPASYGYPLHLHDQVPAAKRPARLDDLVCLHRDYAARALGAGWIDVLPASAELKEWLRRLDAAAPGTREK